VDAEYRKLGLGDQLMKHAMHWLDEQKASSRMVSVAEGNEDVFPFYQRYGFYPRKTLLEYIPPQDKEIKS
jgi:ribosomal protein S18 acetylase RimI-like enzyme